MDKVTYKKLSELDLINQVESDDKVVIETKNGTKTMSFGDLYSAITNDLTKTIQSLSEDIKALKEQLNGISFEVENGNLTASWDE